MGTRGEWDEKYNKRKEVLLILKNIKYLFRVSSEDHLLGRSTDFGFNAILFMENVLSDDQYLIGVKKDELLVFWGGGDVEIRMTVYTDDGRSYSEDFTLDACLTHFTFDKSVLPIDATIEKVQFEPISGISDMDKTFVEADQFFLIQDIKFDKDYERENDG